MLEKYYRINRAAGVGVHVDANGDIVISFCIASIEGSELTLEKKVIGLRSFEELQKQLTEKSAISLSFSGKGVLYKQIEKTDIINKANFGKILPNADFEDFYVQNFISGSSSFIALARKGDLDRWIGQLTGMGFHPLMISLGPFLVYNIADQLNFYEGVFSLDGHIISRDTTGNWISYRYESPKKSQNSVKLGSEKIDEALVIPYAAAFQLILSNQIDTVKADVPLVDEKLGKWLSNIKLKAQSLMILAIFFLLLLVNFVVLSWLGAENSRLDVQASLNDQNTDSLAKMVDVEKRKAAQLNLLGWDGGINKSVLIDQVASLMPPEIVLSEINVNPIDPVSSRTQKSLSFFKGRMQITGVSDQIIPVNEWIARIRAKKWVKNIALDSYLIDNEHNTGRFLIKIDY